jgi:hypothetical protein
MKFINTMPFRTSNGDFFQQIDLQVKIILGDQGIQGHIG